MRRYGAVGAAGFIVAVLALVGVCGPVAAQVPMTLDDFGQPVYPAYEGWYQNPDGSYTLLVGYFNPNTVEVFDVPIGENNNISPGPADQGQPTHFANGRAWGVFSIQVPADFGDKRMTWTVASNNQTISIPLHLQADYFVEPLRDNANGNRPPIIRFSEGGEGVTGPPVGIAHELTASVGSALELSVWTTDPKPETEERPNPRRKRLPLVLSWYRLRGPAEVDFGEAKQEFEESSDQNPTTTATFSEPGEYLLRVEALDETGEGGSGFQCCWTSAHVRVRVSE